MLFNSLEFAIFLPLVFGIYWSIPRDKTLIRNIFLTAASYVFYGWWDWRFLSLLVLSSSTDFWIARKLDTATDEPTRKRLLVLSLVFNLGLLGFFKYFNFFIDSISGAFTLFGHPLDFPVLNIVLPVGISFYTFQSLSYTLDVYRKKLHSVPNIWHFLAFVSFFPQLVAGPIERASRLLPQFASEKTLRYDHLRMGLIYMAIGFFKKMVIADRLAIYVDNGFSRVDNMQGVSAWITVFFFALQLYFDFSAYSNIAMGLSKLLGFELMVNFNRPYLAHSFTEFWKRWHISLSSWFKDYLYIPLGGNRNGRVQTIRNILLVFLLSGLWHGASWNFVIWGALNGLFLLLLDPILLRLPASGIPGMLRRITVFGAWGLSLVFFRAPNLSDALTIFGNLVHFDLPPDPSFFNSQLLLIGSLLLLVFALEWMEEKGESVKIRLVALPTGFRWSLYVLLVLGILLLGAYGLDLNDSRFIYFQF